MTTEYHITLIAVCFIGGIASTSIGTSGGFTFAAMASIFPVSVVVPVHAMVEMFGSIIRGTLLRDHIRWPFLLIFLIGGAVGILLAAPFVDVIPADVLQLILGSFILAVTWFPLGSVVAQSTRYAAIGGTVTSFLTVFIGATGPLVAALLSKRFSEHPQVIATHAACMTGQHAAKIVVFALAGWSMVAFASEILSMILATIAGTWIGRHIILTGPQRLIKLVFKIVVSLLGARLVIDASIRLFDW